MAGLESDTFASMSLETSGNEKSDRESNEKEGDVLSDEEERYLLSDAWFKLSIDDYENGGEKVTTYNKDYSSGLPSSPSFDSEYRDGTDTSLDSKSARSEALKSQRTRVPSGFVHSRIRQVGIFGKRVLSQYYSLFVSRLPRINPGNITER